MKIVLNNYLNQEILTCIYTSTEFTCKVNILNYTQVLLEIYVSSNFKASEFSQDINYLNNLDSIWITLDKNNVILKNFEEFVLHEFKKLSEKWSLSYLI